MYQSDGEVEKDVEVLRRRLKAEPVERQARIITHRNGFDLREPERRWWVVRVSAGERWFIMRRSSDGNLDVYAARQRTQSGEPVATLPTVEAAYFAGVVGIERPS